MIRTPNQLKNQRSAIDSSTNQSGLEVWQKKNTGTGIAGNSREEEQQEQQQKQEKKDKEERRRQR